MNATVCKEVSLWLRLMYAPGVGPVRRLSLLRRFGSPAQVFSQPEAALRTVLPAPVAQALLQAPPAHWVEQHLNWLEQPTHDFITLTDPDYPAPLLNTPCPPILLFVIGRRELLSRPAIAIVGSRHASVSGSDCARRFSRALSLSGFTIVSGLAAGIDTAAHEGALKTASSTIAVVGTGLDQIYPAQNVGLAQHIASEGAIVSEFPLRTPPLAANFPQRNRIISGLSQGCLVVEAASHSGSLITARAAMESNREVFAVPGSIHAPMSKGCHQLIKSGAKLVESLEDILEELAPPAPVSPIPTALPSVRKLPLGLSFEPVDLDTLSMRSGRSVADLQALLLIEELAGTVECLPGGRYRQR